MRLPRIWLLLAAPLAFVSCNQQPEPPPTPAPTPPPPKVTPIPAAAAMERAVQLYPDLGKKDSLFNRAFRDMYEEAKRNRPYILTNVNWPLELAQRTADMLHVASATPSTATPKEHRVGTALDRGAYDSKSARRRATPIPTPGILPF